MEHNYDFRLAKDRQSEKEKIENGIEDWDKVWNDHREAAECHRQVRAKAREIIKPGINVETLW